MAEILISNKSGDLEIVEISNILKIKDARRIRGILLDNKIFSYQPEDDINDFWRVATPQERQIFASFVLDVKQTIKNIRNIVRWREFSWSGRTLCVSKYTKEIINN